MNIHVNHILKNQQGKKKKTQKFHGGNHCKKQPTPLRMEEQREEVEMMGLRSMEREPQLNHLRRGSCAVGVGVSAGYKEAGSCCVGKTASQSQVLHLELTATDGKKARGTLAEDQETLFPFFLLQTSHLHPIAPTPTAKQQGGKSRSMAGRASFKA